MPDWSQVKHYFIPFILQYYTKFLSNSAKPLQLALNHLCKSLWYRLSLMLYILCRNFHKILQSFARYLGLHIDIQIFIWLQTDIHSFLQRTSIYIKNQHNFFEIRNYNLSFNSLNVSLSSECGLSSF